jgi:hypothetical protein
MRRFMAKSRTSGQGRPRGALNKATADIKIAAQQHGAAAIAALAALAGLAPGERAESETARIAAIRELLDRGFGRSTQPLSGDANGAPIAYSFRWADATTPPEPEPEAIDDACDPDDVEELFAAPPC